MSAVSGDARLPRFTTRHRMALALEHTGVTVGEIAVDLGVHRNTVSAWLHGRTPPSTPVLKLWALRCQVPYEWLVDGAEPDADWQAPVLTRWYLPPLEALGVAA